MAEPTGYYAGFWDKNEKPMLLLLGPAIIEGLPDGAILYSITGKQAVKGQDEIDLDTRGGVTAWGVHVEFCRNPDGSYMFQ